MTAAKLRLILAAEADYIETVNTRLAMDFGVAAWDIINTACARLGISRRDWELLQELRCAGEWERQAL